MSGKLPNKNNVTRLDGQPFDLEEVFVHLARLALQGRDADVAALARRNLRRIESRRADLQSSIDAALKLADTTPARRQISRPSPVDSESRMELLRVEASVTLEHEPK